MARKAASYRSARRNAARKTGSLRYWRLDDHYPDMKRADPRDWRRVHFWPKGVTGPLDDATREIWRLHGVGRPAEPARAAS